MLSIVKKVLPFFAVLGCVGELSVVEGVTETSPITWDECSQRMGDHPCDFTLTDSAGKDWSLYDHYGSIIILDFSAEWCGWCQVVAGSTQELQDLYADDDVIYVTVLIEDVYGQPADVELAQWWSDYFGISAPVLVGSRDMISTDELVGWPVTGWPRFFFIDREMTLANSLSGYSDEGILSILDSMLVEDAMNEETDK
jgi:thiol-disulfide isomerase/thioredoxin